MELKVKGRDWFVMFFSLLTIVCVEIVWIGVLGLAYEFTEQFGVGWIAGIIATVVIVVLMGFLIAIMLSVDD